MTLRTAMTNNPYTPPKAAVADPATDAEWIDPPNEVSVATRYLWYSVGVSAFNILVYLLDGFMGNSLLIPVIPLLIIGLLSLLTYHISRRRNWARMTFVALFVLASPLLFLFSNDVFRMAAFVAMLVLQILALYFMFSGAGACWFRREEDSGAAVS